MADVRKNLNEQQRLHAADLLVRGEKFENVLAQFPEHEEEVVALAADVVLMSSNYTALEIPKSTLVRTLNSIPASVTANPAGRYTESRASFINQLTNSMSNWKLGLTLAAIVLLIGGGYAISHRSSGPEVALKGMQENTSAPVVDSNAPLSASDIDSLAAEADQEATLTNGSDADTALVTSDAAAMNDYQTTYNNNEI